MEPVHLDGLLALGEASGGCCVVLPRCEEDLSDGAAGVGTEEDAEGWLEVGFDVDAVGVRRHAELGEQGLVEQALEVVGGGPVGVATVLSEGKGERDELINLVEVSGEGTQSGGDLAELAGKAFLFAAEEVERDGPGVVGFEQLGLLALKLSALGGEGLVLGVGLAAQVLECGS